MGDWSRRLVFWRRFQSTLDATITNSFSMRMQWCCRLENLPLTPPGNLNLGIPSLLELYSKVTPPMNWIDSALILEWKFHPLQRVVKVLRLSSFLVKEITVVTFSGSFWTPFTKCVNLNCHKCKNVSVGGLDPLIFCQHVHIIDIARL